MGAVKNVLIESNAAVDHIEAVAGVMFKELALQYPRGIAAEYLALERIAFTDDLRSIRSVLELIQSEDDISQGIPRDAGRLIRACRYLLQATMQDVPDSIHNPMFQKLTAVDEALAVAAELIAPDKDE